ncbi:MAG TPA: hypothetical protein VFU22_04640 [Roseiflexaceae bacterium]|nr:hypothetical protein [Roseiflexaceae bacterium]
MPMKKDLPDLQSEASTSPLRRGRGLRLSRAAKQSKDLPVEVAARLEPSVPAATPSATPAAAPAQSVALATASLDTELGQGGEALVPTEPEPLKRPREKRKIKLRKDLLKECKRIARAQDRKLYQVIESALESYIQYHGARE